MRLKKAKKIELLKRVRKMLARPKGWAQGGWSRQHRPWLSRVLLGSSMSGSSERDGVAA